MVKNDSECRKLIVEAREYLLPLHQRSSSIQYSNPRKYGQVLYTGEHDVRLVSPIVLIHFVFQLAAVQQTSNE